MKKSELEIYCVWYADGYGAIEHEYKSSLESRTPINCLSFDFCLSKKKLLSSFNSEESAQEFRCMLSAEFHKNSFVGIESIN